MSQERKGVMPPMSSIHAVKDGGYILINHYKYEKGVRKSIEGLMTRGRILPTVFKLREQGHVIVDYSQIPIRVSAKDKRVERIAIKAICDNKGTTKVKAW